MPTRLFPHPRHAEDQPHPHSILTYHVLSRGFQSGAVIGCSIGLARTMLLQQRKPLVATALRSTGVGALIGAAVFVPGLPMYMAGKEEIEWKDRTWRLLENRGQVEVDDWSLGGLVVGGLWAVVRRGGLGRRAGGGRTAMVVSVVGGAAVGDLVGVAGYMIWRYGVHGGRWPEEDNGSGRSVAVS